MDQNGQWIGTLISVGILVLVLGLRMRKARAVQPMRIERLWMLPAFYALVVTALYVSHPPHGLTWLYAALALAAGAGFGWFRGKLMTIHVDPETHQVSQQGSMAAMLFIFVIVGLRYLARYFMGSGGGVDPQLTFAVTDTLLAFGLGFITAQRVEMGLRARSMLEQVRGRAK